MKNKPGEVLLFLAGASLAPLVFGLATKSFTVFIDGLICAVFGALVLHIINGNKPQG